MFFKKRHTMQVKAKAVYINVANYGDHIANISKELKISHKSEKTFFLH